MKKVSFIITSIFFILPMWGVAQSGLSAIAPQTKTVRGCVYEVVPGLAEITKIEVSKGAAESVLNYDEHKITFQFTPMESDNLLTCLKENELEFTLRSNIAKIPVGPQYIQQKKLKEGTKYAMNILQTKDQKACLEQYVYESKALDNDLFEVKEQLIPFIKANYPKIYSDIEVKLEACLATQDTITNTLEVDKRNLKAVLEIEQKKQDYKSNEMKKEGASYIYITRRAAFKKARKIARQKKGKNKKNS
ncbi:hypothetical protein [Aureispira sp. CCB-E]|uniref:hypothetical protein n=1 Tax=Aureispira sp. CCB-E TaxID=3051121 RepID=UPI00286862F6|nr:hypothetical protein [Aureispira sp. CCB-E]WMX16859.1 hypothetical protein QP953_10800 [Aureispira sp. CCB-E]